MIILSPLSLAIRHTFALAVFFAVFLVTHDASGHNDETQKDGVSHFRMQSPLLTKFWGRPMFVEAGVIVPPDHQPETRNTPVCYSIHGFGGSHRRAWRSAGRLLNGMKNGSTPRMLYVFLNAQFPLGHHEFADSVNNGPWGKALTTEFIPALERRFGAVATPNGRFVTGHSSGGWSSLWLQVTYPNFFGGTWSTAPDPVDFRDFSGVDIYTQRNAYFDSDGKEIPLVKRNGKFVLTIKGYAQREVARRDYGGQFASFDAVFSPRGEDGRPMRLFDRETGTIDPKVAKSWERFDIRLILKRHWPQLQPRLRGKLHIYVGLEDTYRLEGAVKLLKKELQTLGSGAEVIFVQGRHHGNLGNPHPKFWPLGMRSHIYAAMWKQWQAQ